MLKNENMKGTKMKKRLFVGILLWTGLTMMTACGDKKAAVENATDSAMETTVISEETVNDAPVVDIPEGAIYIPEEEMTTSQDDGYDYKQGYFPQYDYYAENDDSIADVDQQAFMKKIEGTYVFYDKDANRCYASFSNGVFYWATYELVYIDREFPLYVNEKNELCCDIDGDIFTFKQDPYIEDGILYRADYWTKPDQCMERIDKETYDHDVSGIAECQYDGILMPDDFFNHNR